MLTLPRCAIAVVLVLISGSLSEGVGNNVTVLCPDGKFQCFGDMTCCPLTDNHYGCCPYPDATCCADLQHCCPADTTCDILHGVCRRQDGDVIPFLANTKAMVRVKPADDSKAADKIPSDSSSEENEISLDSSKKNVCPGGIQTCADGFTCCPTPYGDYGCCPIQDAVCCSDQIHCCPKGTECDVKQGSCKKKTSENAKSVMCPGGVYQCPDHTTCCLMPGGQYGCCPLQNATCCADMLHCCPAGYKCNSAGMCYLANVPWETPKHKTIPATKVN